MNPKIIIELVTDDEFNDFIVFLSFIYSKGWLGRPHCCDVMENFSG
jgi:hypothetical protein